MQKEVLKFSSIKDLAQQAGKDILNLAQIKIKEKGFFTLVLSGGKTPEVLYELLATDPLYANFPWKNTYLFWGDERCVAKDHPDSNYGMAFTSLLTNIAIPSINIYRVPSELPPQQGADVYENSLKKFFKKKSIANYFDLVLLGLGSDGHIASLFPGDESLEEKERLCVAVSAPLGVFPRDRITMTLSLINASSSVKFLVSGSNKQKILADILTDKSTSPASRVNPGDSLCWLINV
jgi:6-phosphogluconolactonase